MPRSHHILRTRRLALAGALALGVTFVAAHGAGAQEVGMGSAAMRPTIEDLTAQWASVERPLLGVADLTDLQRDAIELLEEKHRKLFNIEAGPIRQARIALLQRGPFERQRVEQALQRMVELRRAELQLLRGLLTDTQRVRYDQNLKLLAAEEAAAETKRDREAAFVTP